jgi:hypothetical protein
VVAVRIDRPDDGDAADSKPSADAGDDIGKPEPPVTRNRDAPESAEPAGPAAPGADADTADGAGSPLRQQRARGYRANAGAIYDAQAGGRLIDSDRARSIDAGCARVELVERETVTPAMRRIEAEDPGRRLAGLENRLKERYRIEEKVTEVIEERGHSVAEAFALVKDAIRYTFCYSEDHYAEGVRADCERLENAGFERADRRNSWEHDEYKGINSRWRVPGRGQFEVQFHTETSLAAKEETHDAYKQLRTLPEDAEVSRLHAYQREVTAKVPIPPGALDIPDYP